jgi:predicted nucleotidyltransferase
MKVDWTKTVEGVPLKVVRDMMRDLRRGYPTRDQIAATTCEHIVKAGRRWSSDQVMPVRSSDDVDFILTELVPKGRLQIVIGNRVWSPAKIRRTGQAMTDALLAEGLLRPRQSEAREACYEVTDAGIGLACASVTKRIDRAQAERYVAELLARADAINADADAFCRVKAIWAYGSYVKGAAELGDIDLMVDLTHDGSAAYHALADDQYERLEASDLLERRAKRRLRGGNRHLHLIWHKSEEVTGPVEQIYPQAKRPRGGDARRAQRSPVSD